MLCIVDHDYDSWLLLAHKLRFHFRFFFFCVKYEYVSCEFDQKNGVARQLHELRDAPVTRAPPSFLVEDIGRCLSRML